MSEEQLSRSPTSAETPHNNVRSRKGIRNKNACDACRSRKVRCLYMADDARCQGCTFLDIDCTHDRPRKRRGPPNRHAHSNSSAEVANTNPAATAVSRSLAPVASSASPASPFLGLNPSGVRHEAGLASENPRGSGHGGFPYSFPPPEAVSQAIDDWFEKIHPVAPILARRRFLRRYKEEEAASNPIFYGLVVSICAATAATLPREHYGPITVTSSVDFIERNGLLARGFFQPPSTTLDWCISMYNLGTALGSVSGADLSDKRSYHKLSEAAMGTRYLAYYCMPHLDYVEQQLTRRLFSLLYVGLYSTDMLGRLAIGLATPGYESICARPLPLSDNQLDPPTAGHRDATPWHGDNTSYIPGLNSLCDLFGIWHEIQSTPPNRDPKESIDRYLRMVQQVIDNLTPELRWRGGLSRQPGATKGHDVQIANLFVTSLHLRSNILQKFGTAGSYGAEHQRIVDDLLEVLYHMPQAVFEANGPSLVPKIRDIGAAYLEQFHEEGVSNEVGNHGGKQRLERLLSRLDDLDYWHGLSLADAQPP